MPLKQLLREDGLGLVRKQDVIEKLVEKANNTTSLLDLWGITKPVIKSTLKKG
ncbi:MAG: hypothetical protein NTW85_06120 [Methylococcales bacterium]|nr:hypothetical protein [Methylococcales bacterium]